TVGANLVFAPPRRGCENNRANTRFAPTMARWDTGSATTPTGRTQGSPLRWPDGILVLPRHQQGEHKVRPYGGHMGYWFCHDTNRANTRFAPTVVRRARGIHAQWSVVQRIRSSESTLRIHCCFVARNLLWFARIFVFS